MDIFDVLTLIGGLSLFLFGMNLMGGAPERSAGSKLEIMIGKLTSGKIAGLLTGRSDPHCYYPVQLRISRYFAGTCGYRCRFLPKSIFPLYKIL